MKNPVLQKGSSSTEWIVIVFALVAALFVPFDGNNSVASIFMDAVRVFHANSSFPMSLP